MSSRRLQSSCNSCCDKFMCFAEEAARSGGVLRPYLSAPTLSVIMWIFFPFGPRAGAATQSVGERSRRPRTGRAQHPQMWRLAGARGVRACVHVRVHAGAGRLNREHLVEPGAQLPEKLSAGHGVSKASRHVRGLEHSKIIKRKSCELKFMVEPACLGGAGFAGTADASQAAGAGGNWTPGSLGGGAGGRRLSHNTAAWWPLLAGGSQLRLHTGRCWQSI